MPSSREEPKISMYHGNPIQRRCDNNCDTDIRIRFHGPIDEHFCSDKTERSGETDTRQAGDHKQDRKCGSMIIQALKILQ